jgi:ribosomal protein S18 acetylase RimI-like enzyme
MSVEIEHRLPNVSEFMALRGETDWGVPNESATELVLSRSFSGVVATENGKAVGMARTVGDGCLILYIQDVIVAPSHRSTGIGRLLIRSLLLESSKSCLPSCTIGLFAATGQSGFYEKLGFGTRNNPAYGPGMHAPLSKLAKHINAA